ncbi:hypothetical protein [Mycoplasma hafezii]|uniref:hypothetical protein n=1 Tax=Mycoplasma hafezii TaxID=525886 RepID=UPI003CF682FF
MKKRFKKLLLTSGISVVASPLLVLSAGCDNDVKPAPEPKPEPAPEPKPEPAPEPKPEPAPEPKPEPAPEPKPEPAPEPKPEPAPEPKPEPAPEPKPEPAPEPKPEPAPEPKPEPAPEPKPEPAPEPKPEPAPEPKPEPAPEPKPEPAPEPKPEPAPEPKPEPAPEPDNNNKPIEKNIKNVTVIFDKDLLMQNKITVAQLKQPGFDYKKYIKDISVLYWDGDFTTEKYPSNNLQFASLELKETNKGLVATGSIASIKTGKFLFSGEIDLRDYEYTTNDYLDYLVDHQLKAKNLSENQLNSYPSSYLAKKEQGIDFGFSFFELPAEYQMYENEAIQSETQFYPNDLDGSLTVNISLRYYDSNFGSNVTSKNLVHTFTGFQSLQNLNMFISHTADFAMNQDKSKKVFDWYAAAENKENLILDKQKLMRLGLADMQIIRPTNATDSKFNLNLSANYNLTVAVGQANYILNKQGDNFNTDNGLVANKFQIPYLNISFKDASTALYSENRIEILVNYTIAAEVYNSNDSSSTTTKEFSGQMKLYFTK